MRVKMLPMSSALPDEYKAGNVEFKKVKYKKPQACNIGRGSKSALYTIGLGLFFRYRKLKALWRLYIAKPIRPPYPAISKPHFYSIVKDYLKILTALGRVVPALIGFIHYGRVSR